MKKRLTISMLLLCACTLQAQEGLYPLSGWYMHPGLNATLSASVIVSPRSWSGFSNSLSIAYADSIMSRLTYAVGGYVRHMSWQGRSFSDAGLTAMLNYRFDEHWEAYIYAQKSLTNNHQAPLPLYSSMYSLGGLHNGWGDRIGAAVRYNFNPSFSIEVSLEKQWLPNPDNLYYGRYNYPVP